MYVTTKLNLLRYLDNKKNRNNESENYGSK